MSQQITTTEQSSGPRTIASIIQSDRVKSQVALALPSFLTADRMVRVALTTINKTPKLMECTPESLLSSLMQASQMGIEPDGRYGHLIPRWNSKAGKMECQFQPDYKGLLMLVRRNPDVADVYASLVHQNDYFKVKAGLHRDIEHEQTPLDKDPGAIIGAYAVIQFKSGMSSYDMMRKSEIDAIRARSQSGNAGPWVSDYGEMAKKTVLKRLLKLADLSGDTSERLAVEDTYVSQREEETPRLEGIPKAALPVLPSSSPTKVVSEEETTPVQVETPAKASRIATRPKKEEPAKPAPAPEPEPEPTPEPEAEAVVIDSTEAEQEPASDEPLPLSKQVFNRAHECGFKESHVVDMAIRHRFAETTAKTIADIKDDKLEMILEDWENAVEVMTAIKAKGSK